MSAPRIAPRSIARRTTAAIAATAIAALVLAACTGGGEDGTTTDGSQGFPDDGCTHITIATSSRSRPRRRSWRPAAPQARR